MTTAITFLNGTTLTAERNGDCFITDSKPDFPDDLTTVVISDASGEYELHDAEPVECASVDGRYWFAFRELSPEELWRKQFENDFDILLDMSAEQEYRLCLMDLGLN